MSSTPGESIPDDVVASYAQAVVGAWVVGHSARERAGLGLAESDAEVGELLAYLRDGEALAAGLATLIEWGVRAARVAASDGADADELLAAGRALDPVGARLVNALGAARDDGGLGALEALFELTRDLDLSPAALGAALADAVSSLVALALDAAAGARPWFVTLALVDPRPHAYGTPRHEGSPGA